MIDDFLFQISIENYKIAYVAILYIYIILPSDTFILFYK